MLNFGSAAASPDVVDVTQVEAVIGDTHAAHVAVVSTLPGDVAFPMRARGQVTGVLILGPRRTGETFAPDEMKVIHRLAHSISGAIDALNIQIDPALRRIEMRLDQLTEQLIERALLTDTSER